LIAASPVQELKNSKPRFRPKGKIPEITRERLSKLSEEYLRVRNEQMRNKQLSAQMALAKERGELIPKRLACLQAAFYPSVEHSRTPSRRLT
jgi:hypothetical protein